MQLLKQICRYSDVNTQKNLEKGSFIQYVSKIFWNTKISQSLIHTRTCAYQGVRNVRVFLENFAYVLNEITSFLTTNVW